MKEKQTNKNKDIKKEKKNNLRIKKKKKNAKDR